MKPNLAVAIGKLKLRNPVMVASGTFGYGQEFKPFMNLKSLGAIVTKTITMNPRQGNPAPRTCETPSGMLNSIGLENPGVDGFIKEKLPKLNRLGVPVIVSIASEQDPEEFAFLIRRLEKTRGVSAYELNISCPNVAHPGMVESGVRLIAQDVRATRAVVRRCRALTRKPLITKLSPNVTDIVAIAQAAEDAGSDALALINTLTGMSIDVSTRAPRIGRTVGGLSGPAIRPVAVRMVYEVHRKISVPLIGMGGIIDASSALEFILAGATAVAVGTMNFVHPAAARDIIDGIRAYCAHEGIVDIKDLIGGMQP